MIIRRHKKIRGHAINDANYNVKNINNSSSSKSSVVCPFYRKWSHMLDRCYSNALHSKFPTYKECYVCDEWLLFSNFKKWMEKQDWEGKELDKDLMVTENKEYSPSRCCFISKKLNTFIRLNKPKDKFLPLGVYDDLKSGMFRARILINKKKSWTWIV